MAGQDIRQEIKKVVDKFGWDANLLDGFWVNLNVGNAPIYCSSASLPNIGVEYENVSISVNNFKTPVPVSITKGELVLEVTGGTAAYIKNIKNMFSFGTLGAKWGPTKLFTIMVYTYTVNYGQLSSIKYSNCYLKNIGEISYEHGNSNSLFKCPYTFTVGAIG